MMQALRTLGHHAGRIQGKEELAPEASRQQGKPPFLCPRAGCPGLMAAAADQATLPLPMPYRRAT